MNFIDLSESQQQTIEMLAAEHVGRPFTLDLAGNGRNSRIYRLSGEDHPAYAVKVYFRQPTDLRDRLGTEFQSLQFLWENGIRSIPKPFTNRPEAGIALYEFIEGDKILPEEIGPHEI